MPAQKTTREAIITTAIQVFRQQGYHKTSMSDLAAACGLQKGSFYHYFKNKEALMQAVLDMLHQYYRKKVFAVAYQAEISAKERFIELFRMQEPIVTQNLSGCLFGNTALEGNSEHSDFRPYLQAFFSDWIDAFEHLYREHYSQEQARALAQQSVAEVEGAIMLMRIYKDTTLLRTTCERILAQLENPPDGGQSTDQPA